MSSKNQVCQDYSWYVHLIQVLSLRQVHDLQDQIKRHAQEAKKHMYTLILTPRVSTLVTRILEEEGVLGEVTLTALNLQFIPLAEDVISLENESAFRELWVVLAFEPSPN
jgi:hypothetical protein